LKRICCDSEPGCCKSSSPSVPSAPAWPLLDSRGRSRFHAGCVSPAPVRLREGAPFDPRLGPPADVSRLRPGASAGWRAVESGGRSLRLPGGRALEHPVYRGLPRPVFSETSACATLTLSAPMVIWRGNGGDPGASAGDSLISMRPVDVACRGCLQDYQSQETR